MGSITIKNRIELAPVGPFLATSDGYVSRELIEWCKQFARGGAGIVTMGNSSVIQPVRPGAGYAIHVGHDKSINPLNRFADVVQRYGAKASIQLNYHNTCPPTEMKTSEIEAIIESFAEAAYRCLRAGLDMIQVHGAHGHLLSQFLTPRTNARTDEYGGSLENRAKFALAVLDAIRSRVGNRMAVEYRISADECVPGSLTLDETLEYMKLIQDRIDLVHVSVGNLYEPGTMPLMNQPAYFPRGLNIPYAERFKKELKIPVAIVGAFDLPMADQIVADNKADVVAMARTLIADPDCVNKARRGQETAIRPCIRCNVCINRSHYQFLSVRCAVNPVIGREAELKYLPPPTRRKKVVVIGGGPAGLEAARTAAGRGHRVVLYEKSDRLGGALIMASSAPFKADMRASLDWAVRTTLESSDIKVNLETEAAPDLVRADEPDVIILAAGSLPVVPRIPGIDRPNVVLAGDVDSGKAKVGSRVVIAGAGLTGSETALYLARQGREVTLIDSCPLEQIDAGTPVINIMTLRKMLSESNVVTRTGLTLEAVTDSGVFVLDRDQRQIGLPCDTVVLALGFEPDPAVLERYQGLALEVYPVGDCHSRKGNLWNAVAEGFFAAADIG